MGYIIFLNNIFNQEGSLYLGMTHVSWESTLLSVFLLPIVFHNVTVL